MAQTPLKGQTGPHRAVDLDSHTDPGVGPSKQASNSGAERRDADNERVAIELRVEYNRLNAFFSDYTKNISRGGTFIPTANPVPVGTEFAFALVLPGDNPPVRLRGRVTWVVPADDVGGREPGMGVEFIFTSNEQREELNYVVKQLMAKTLGPRNASKLLRKG